MKYGKGKLPPLSIPALRLASVMIAAMKIKIES
jgi:hypothetical protein